jgi:hypothetical protein
MAGLALLSSSFVPGTSSGISTLAVVAMAWARHSERERRLPHKFKFKIQNIVVLTKTHNSKKITAISLLK